jgi:hypothetical protein
MAFVGGNRRGGTRFHWNKGKLEKLIGTAAAEALQKAGLLVRRNTQRSMVGGSTPSGRTPRKNPIFRVYGEFDGYPVIGAIRKVPRPDKVSSWAPSAFLRNDIQSDWDHGSRSVVVGPSKEPWLNQLHEFGGSKSYYVAIPRTPAPYYGGKKVPKSLQRKGSKGWGAYVGYVTDRPTGFPIGVRQISGKGYMEIGLQRSLNKIPQQFHNAISRGSAM